MGHFTKSTSRSPFCLKLSHQENLPAGTTVDRFTMSTPLDQRRAPALNHGGSFTVNFASQPNTATKVKVHNKLYHLLRAVTLVEFPAPALNRQAVRQLRQINTIFQDVRQHRDLIGGIRIEVRVAATTLEEAEAIVEREQPHKIKTFLGLATIEISTENYLQITNQLINEATETLTKNGVTNHSVQRELTRTEKKTLGDLRLLIGYSHNGYKTDPIKGNAWWRRVNVNASATHPPLPPPPPPPPIQQTQPPDHSTNATLCRLCRRYRSQTWKRCINWSIALNRNRREHPQVNSSDEKFVDIPRDGIC